MNIQTQVRKCLDASCGEQSIFYDGLSGDVDLDYKMNPHGILCPKCNEWTIWWSDIPFGVLFVFDWKEL